MTKKEGLVTLDALKQSLEGGYATLQELYESVHHPVARDLSQHCYTQLQILSL